MHSVGVQASSQRAKDVNAGGRSLGTDREPENPRALKLYTPSGFAKLRFTLIGLPWRLTPFPTRNNWVGTRERRFIKGSAG